MNSSIAQIICPNYPENALCLISPSPESAGYLGQCACWYPIEANIPRFVRLNSYASSFELQWKTFRRTQLDSYTGTTISRDRLARILGGLLESVRGRKVLEIGCGAGYFSEILLQYGAQLVSIDISSAVEAPYANCGHYTNFFLAQADVCHLPFAADQFDIVVCIGVIQHTPISEILKAWALLDIHDTLADVYKHLQSAEQIVEVLESLGLERVAAATPVMMWKHEHGRHHEVYGLTKYSKLR